jgi:hypothetical protein
MIPRATSQLFSCGPLIFSHQSFNSNSSNKFWLLCGTMLVGFRFCFSCSRSFASFLWTLLRFVLETGALARLTFEFLLFFGGCRFFPLVPGVSLASSIEMWSFLWNEWCVEHYTLFPFFLCVDKAFSRFPLKGHCMRSVLVELEFLVRPPM